MNPEKNQIKIEDTFPSLSITLSRLLNNQEKNWGLFQVKKEDGFFQLDIPNLPKLYLHKNESDRNYRVYLDETEPDTKKKRKRVIFTRTKQKTVNSSKIQLTYEVVYKHDEKIGTQTIYKILANLIGEKIKESLNVSENVPSELLPQVRVIAEI